jgi:hypothetical protein
MADTATATTVTVQKSIYKKPSTKTIPLGVLILSKDDLKEIHNKFTKTIQSDDFKQWFVVKTTFKFENDKECDATFKLFHINNEIKWNDEGFENAYSEPDIIGFDSKIVPGNYSDDDSYIQVRLTLSKNDARLIFRLIDGRNVEQQNLHLEHLVEDVTRYLNKKQKFTSKLFKRSNKASFKREKPNILSAIKEYLKSNATIIMVYATIVIAVFTIIIAICTVYPYLKELLLAALILSIIVVAFSSYFFMLRKP